MRFDSKMSDDVGNEVRRILSNNTIEQVISYNATIKKDIQQSHDELRNVVGQRYRDLILACDKVVGMEDVCRQVLSSFKAVDWKKRGNASLTHQQQADGAAASTTDSVASQSSPVIEAATVKDAVVANQLQRRLNSVRALTGGRAFLDAAVSFRAVQAKLSDVGRSSPLYSRLLEPIERSAEIVLRDTLYSMRRHIVVLGKGSASAGAAPQSVIEPYRDLHSAVELLHACSPSHALSILCDLHVQALGVLLPAPAQSLEQQLLSACGIYFNLLWYCTVAPSIPPGYASTIVPTTLAALTASDASLETLSLQVVGLRILSQQPQSAASRLDGWALSPATARPELKIDLDGVVQVQQKAAATIRTLLTDTSHSSVDDLRLLHGKLKAAADLLVRRLEGLAQEGSQVQLFPAEQWSAIVSSAVDQASKQVLTDLLRLCTERCVSTLDAAALATTYQVRADPSAQQLSISAIFTDPGCLFQRSNSFSTIESITSPATPMSPASRRRAAASEDLRDGLQLLSKAVEATAEPLSISSLVQSFLDSMIEQLSRRIVKAHAEEHIPGLFAISSVVDSFLAAPLMSTGAYARAAAQLERMYIDSHRLWISNTVAGQCGELLDHPAVPTFFSWAKTWSSVSSGDAKDEAAIATEVRSALSNCWASHTIEGAVVSYPYRCSPGISSTLMKVQQIIHSAGPATRLALINSTVQEAVLGKFIAYYSELARNAEGSPVLACEETLLQMAFDVVFVGTAYSGAHPSAHRASSSSAQLPTSARQLLSLIEDKVDVVTWSTAYPLLFAAATSAAAASTLCYGFVGCSSAASPATQSDSGSASSLGHAADVPVFSLPEVDRFPLLPLSTPTQPKPNIAALLSSVNVADDRPVTASRSVKDAASLLAGATKGLRSVLWGES